MQNYIKSYRKRAFGEPAVSIEDMIDFCEQRLAVPEDVDEPFVIAYGHSKLPNQLNEPESSDEEDDESTNWFRYIMTTKRLLHNAKTANIAHTDATNKIVIQRYPLLIFGATDKTPERKFHPIAYMVSKHETADDFAFGFKAIRSAMLFETNTNFSPEYLMADAAAAVGNGFKRVFGDENTVLMCEAHMKRAVDRRKFNDADNHKEPLKADLDKLKLAYNDTSFRQG